MSRWCVRRELLLQMFERHSPDPDNKGSGA
jgi:hypothetical protein